MKSDTPTPPLPFHHLTAIIYARFSPRPDSAPDAEDSNDKQISRCQAYALSKGYKINDFLIFRDDALTGLDLEQDPDPTKSITRRTGLLHALEVARKGHVFIVRWRNRIARDPYVQAWVRRTLHKKGVEIEAADETNVSGLAGELLENAQAIIDKYRAIQIGIDTALAMRRHQAEGRRMTRKDRTPFGWMADPLNPDLLVHCDQEVDTIKVIAGLWVNGMTSPTQICRALDAEGIPRRGKKWADGRTTVIGIVKRQEFAVYLREAEKLKNEKDRMDEVDSKYGIHGDTTQGAGISTSIPSIA